MDKELSKIVKKFLIRPYINKVSIGIFSLHSGIEDHWYFGEAREDIIYDLSSLTKPLTLSYLYLKNYRDILSKEERVPYELLLNHQAGLPAFGILEKNFWKNQILKYPIKKSDTCYSDFSSLRLMLELEKYSGKTLEEECSHFFHKNLSYWKLAEEKITIQDPNALNLQRFCSNSGLVGNIKGVAKHLKKIEDDCGLRNLCMKELLGGYKDRFIYGLDRVLDFKNTLAGKSERKHVLGHLGFSGTSFWLDLEAKYGYILLTDGGLTYWYDRSLLNKLRRELGEYLWKHLPQK